jgi:hypothetical protein
MQRHSLTLQLRQQEQFVFAIEERVWVTNIIKTTLPYVPVTNKDLED